MDSSTSFLHLLIPLAFIDHRHEFNGRGSTPSITMGPQQGFCTAGRAGTSMPISPSSSLSQRRTPLLTDSHPLTLTLTPAHPTTAPADAWDLVPSPGPSPAAPESEPCQWSRKLSASYISTVAAPKRTSVVPASWYLWPWLPSPLDNLLLSNGTWQG